MCRMFKQKNSQGTKNNTNILMLFLHSLDCRDGTGLVELGLLLLLLMSIFLNPSVMLAP